MDGAEAVPFQGAGVSLHCSGCIPLRPHPAEAETKAQGEAREARSHVCTWLGTGQEGSHSEPHTGGRREGGPGGQGRAGRGLGAEQGGTRPVGSGGAGAPGPWPGLLPTSSPTSWTGVSGWGDLVQQQALSHTGHPTLGTCTAR